jgi:cysteine desulfurase/selenocysteine lyase
MTAQPIKAEASTKAFDAQSVRLDFPVLGQQVHGKPLAFLDSAASAQKPNAVLDRLCAVYSEHYANIHRGLYALSERSTEAFEETRSKVANFLNAATEKEIVFTKGATEGINLVAHSYGLTNLKPGDEILLSQMEHHANIVPWQQVAKQTGASIKVIPIFDNGELDMETFSNTLSERTKVVSMLHTSNALGTELPMQEIITQAHQAGAVVLVDACQSVVHQPIDVQALDADFLVFSGHKLYGPNGTGVLYGKYRLLEQMEPYQTGGEMIENVDFEQGSTFQEPPLRFEAGTPVIAEVIALGDAIDYVAACDREAVRSHEKVLMQKTTEAIRDLQGFRIIGEAQNKAAIVSFIHSEAHPNDIGAILDQCGVAVRAGHHCAMPLMKRLNVPATVRASFAMYNTEQDVEALIIGLHKVNKLFGAG